MRSHFKTKSRISLYLVSSFLKQLHHRRPKLTFRESEKLIIYLFIYASRLRELERDLSSYAVLGYMRTVENLSAL